MSGLCLDTNHATQAWAGVPLTRARYRVAEDVLRERLAQDAKWGQQDHPDGTGRPDDGWLSSWQRERTQKATEAGTLTWRDVLSEEMREAYAETDPTKLRAELVQVAAVAVAWIESIDRRADA